MKSPRAILRTLVGLAIIVVSLNLAYGWLEDSSLETTAESVREIALEVAAREQPEKTQKNAILALRQEFGNDDIMGHLVVDGTGIDYIVTQAEDNSFYLTHDIWKNDSVAGWVFVDAYSSLDPPSKNIVVYGHNMRNPIMFHELREFKKSGFFFDHREVTFDTLYESGKYKIFAFYETTVDFPFNTSSFSSGEDFLSLIA
ncbi:MAG: class B sortase, partial [Clostridiales bacterium]|nr:class B sortase [Clostridiales bacterium]